MKIQGYFHIKRPDIVHETIEGETVIVNLENGVYYSLRYSGVDVWNLIETGANYDEIIEMIIQHFEGNPDVIKKSVKDLLRILQKEGLVEVSTKKRSVTDSPQSIDHTEKKPFTSPVLEKYSDLQNLLLLDPIHEVDEEGWPNEANPDNHNDQKQ